MVPQEYCKLIFVGWTFLSRMDMVPSFHDYGGDNEEENGETLQSSVDVYVIQ